MRPFVGAAGQMRICCGVLGRRCELSVSSEQSKARDVLEVKWVELGI